VVLFVVEQESAKFVTHTRQVQQHHRREVFDINIVWSVVGVAGVGVQVVCVNVASQNGRRSVK